MTKESRYGQVSSDFGADNVGCDGTEPGLANCTFNSQDDCGGGEGAGVVCDTRSVKEIEDEKKMIATCFEEGVSYHYGEYIDFDVVDRLVNIRENKSLYFG